MGLTEAFSVEFHPKKSFTLWETLDGKLTLMFSLPERLLFCHLSFVKLISLMFSEFSFLVIIANLPSFS